MPFQFPGTSRGGGFSFPQQRQPQQRRQRPMFGGGGRASTANRGVGSAIKMRLLIAAGIAVFALISYYGKPGDVNEVTGETERVAMTEEAEEIQLGLQAAPQMISQHGGPSRSLADRQRVHNIGQRLLAALDEKLADSDRHNPYRDSFHFTLLADPKTVNAFALPGGPVFITEALYSRLSDGQLAGVLGHEIGHVLLRHGNKRMAKQGLYQGLAGAMGVLGGDAGGARMAQMVSSALSMKYGREHELEADKWSVTLTANAGYDPRAMIGVMKILDEATGGDGPPEFLSTHPKPANRVEYIEEVIAETFPNGVPEGLRQ
ncbi:M48 family metalloprotease [Adhaeretor mobilis]|uniref:TPR repeat-containing protein YfgC n=1 Tax=Adhaeretor mobilis TaxID=1930276 RepID=A0A517N2R8_9BACT|nr:M48 family metalloprotease [Adhaeretor mobilis]QDT01431.1 TPR repeat-containing protein YfgC precursor [Adhaeretor mobilis]